MGYVMPEDPELISLLKKPWGLVVRDLKKYVKELENSFIVVVGDYTFQKCLKTGLKPAIAIIDGKVMRSPVKYEVPKGYKVVSVTNPKGSITLEVLKTLKEALKRAEKNEKTLLVVKGEEDLLALPVMVFLRDGDYLLYGQPGEGTVIVKVTGKVREKAINVLNKFRRV